jgi:hypothetical protein
MTGRTLRHALAYARHGWPVFPCRPGQKAPATPHGYLDATTDPDQVSAWFTRHPDWNLAVATGAPGPDVLDVDQHGEAGNGFGALARLRAAGLLDGAFACVGTPGGGLHVYFAGSAQRSAHLPARHIDFLSVGGYVIAPPSRIHGQPYKFASAPAGHRQLDWQAAASLLEPAGQQSPGHRQKQLAPRQQPPEPRRPPHEPAQQPPQSGQDTAGPGPQQHGPAQQPVGSGQQQPGARQQQPGSSQPGRPGTSHLPGWVASQPEGNRNAGLFWAANRALEADPAADLGPLAAAAHDAGLSAAEITRTLTSARRTSPTQPRTQGTPAEGEPR